MKRFLIIFFLMAHVVFAQNALSEFEAYKNQQNAEFQKFTSGGSYFSEPIDTKPVIIAPSQRPSPAIPRDVRDYASLKQAFDGHVDMMDTEFTIFMSTNPQPYMEKVTDLNAGAYNAYYIQLKKRDSTYELSYRLSYNDDYKVLQAWQNPELKAKLDKHEQALYAEALRLLPKLINKGMNEEERALAIHDYLVSAVTYDQRVLKNIQSNPNAFKAYGALLDKVAVCDGYTKAMRLLGTMAGLKVIKVNGSSNRVPHSWNKISMGGGWYNVDVTFDDPIGAPADMAIRRDYFKLTDAQLRKDHAW